MVLGLVVAKSDRTHQVVVVGGGAGGLELATQLRNRFRRSIHVRITLVERARAHMWKPLLHEVAAGSLDRGENELDYLAQAHWHHFTYRFGEMNGLERSLFL
jgi:NADH dehydrogenase